MKRNIITMMLLALPVSAWSADNISQPDTIDTIFADPFFSQSHMTLSLKNYWKYLKEEESERKKVHNAWGQGVAVDYQSGYFADIIGFDATYYGAMKLGASDYFNSRGVLYNDGPGDKKSNAEGYSKLGQRNIKLKYKLADVNLNARWGWQTVKNLGVLSNSTRLSPTTYLGWSGGVNYDAFTLRGAYVESSMGRNSPDKQRFQTNDGRYINHIVSSDIQWKNEMLKLQYGYGESDNYLRRQILFTHFNPLKQLTIGTQIYATHALDEYKAMAASKRDFDKNARHYTIDVKWQDEGWSTKFGVGYTDAEKAHQVGFFPRHMSKNSRGTFSSMAYAGSDYMRDGELFLANISDYNLTPDLAIGVTGNIAQFNYRGNHVRTGEINAFSRWTPTHPKLKNLNVWMMFGPGWSYRMNQKTPVLNDGHYIRAHSLSSEVIIEYKFNVF